jgi:hypothetical protein
LFGQLRVLLGYARPSRQIENAVRVRALLIHVVARVAQGISYPEKNSA